MGKKAAENIKNALAEFEKACTGLLSTKYILAEKKISAILQVIAKNSVLYDFVAACMDGFDFKAAFSIAKPQDEKSVGLTLPSDPKHVVAFVFCLLLSFDTKQTDFKQFLSAFYYNAEGPTREFEQFVHETIVPFCVNLIRHVGGVAETPAQDAGVAAVSSAQPQQSREQQQQYQEQQSQQTVSPTTVEQVPSNQQPPQSHNLPDGYVGNTALVQTQMQPRYGQMAQYDGALPQLEPDEPPAFNSERALDEQLLSDLHVASKELIGHVARDSYLTLQDREELLLVCEAFEQAVALRAERPIRTMYIALKYTIRCSAIVRYLEAHCNLLEKIIKVMDLD